MRWATPLTLWNNRVVFGKAAAQLDRQSAVHPAKVAAWTKSWCLSRAIYKGHTARQVPERREPHFQISFLPFHVILALCSSSKGKWAGISGGPRLQEVVVHRHGPAWLFAERVWFTAYYLLYFKRMFSKIVVFYKQRRTINLNIKAPWKLRLKMRF